MNYGKFFRLNQQTSRIEDGIAVFEYIDLPSFLDLSSGYAMSPKYPISVTITSNSVHFLLHYSTYKDRHGSNSHYFFDLSQMRITDKCEERHHLDVAHMEELIIDLPFQGIGQSYLSETIRNIYTSEFPMRVNELGGRFLERLLDERYSPDFSSNNNEFIKDYFYSRLKSNTPAYSSLKQMGSKGDKWECLEIYEQKEEISHRDQQCDF